MLTHTQETINEQKQQGKKHTSTKTTGCTRQKEQLYGHIPFD